MKKKYEALLLVSFGGPEGPADIEPFLEKIAKGRNIPASRLIDVAERYKTVGGVSPLNANIRKLKEDLEDELINRDIDIPIFIGNRNTKPFITDAVNQMKVAGIQNCLAWLSSPYSSFSSCRQYTQNIEDAVLQVGGNELSIDQIRRHHDHPGLIKTAAERLKKAIEKLPEDLREQVVLLFSAHSLPVAMAEACRYEAEIREASFLVGEIVDPDNFLRKEIVWQSRSGPPIVPWLEPDINDRIAELASEGCRSIAVSPIGFPIENFEIAWDLDIEAAEKAASLDVAFARAKAVNNDPKFPSMVADLLCERLEIPVKEKSALGKFGASPDKCGKDCCFY